MIRRFLAIFRARNIEFVRDRSSVIWNLAVPVLLVLAMAWIFSEEARPVFKVGVVAPERELDSETHPFFSTRHIQFITVADETLAIRKVTRHQLDMLLDPTGKRAYWVNTDSPKGYILEKMLLGSGGTPLSRAPVSGEPVRYIDWLLPGILGMNMMFSCFFGVGFIVVRYRKTGFLKRLNATPLRAVEFLSAQIASRLLITVTSMSLVFAGMSTLLDIRMEGSYLLLFVVAALGAISMIALALVVISRVNSEELASGLLNFLGWPMMLLSGVWFSMEGSNQVLQAASQILPLTHILEAARAIMIDGSGWAHVASNLIVLSAMGVICLIAGAYLFQWRSEA